MGHDWIKISLMAEELGVTTKTVYNWISSGKLFMPRAGFVSRTDAYEVWFQQKDLRKIYSYFISVKGTNRDANGRFKSKQEVADERGE